MQLLETIKCKNGKLYNLEFHQKRFEQARKKWFPKAQYLTLSELIQIPEEFEKGLYRCRILYAAEIDKIEFIPHQYRKIESLKLVEDNAIDYTYKYTNRERLNALFEFREKCDDILIVKNGYVTDSFTANPIFFDGKRWWTPDTPLLAGTQRERYIAEGAISVCKITPSELYRYQKVGLINALQDMNDMPLINIHKIISL